MYMEVRVTLCGVNMHPESCYEKSMISRTKTWHSKDNSCTPCSTDLRHTVSSKIWKKYGIKVCFDTV